MKFFYAIKGCSHCDLRESCNLKNHRANLSEKGRFVDDPINPKKQWWTRCKDFYRNPRISEGSS